MPLLVAIGGAARQKDRARGMKAEPFHVRGTFELLEFVALQIVQDNGAVVAGHGQELRNLCWIAFGAIQVGGRGGNTVRVGVRQLHARGGGNG